MYVCRSYLWRGCWEMDGEGRLMKGSEWEGEGGPGGGLGLVTV